MIAGTAEDRNVVPIGRVVAGEGTLGARGEIQPGMRVGGAMPKQNPQLRENRGAVDVPRVKHNSDGVWMAVVRKNDQVVRRRRRPGSAILPIRIEKTPTNRLKEQEATTTGIRPTYKAWRKI